MPVISSMEMVRRGWPQFCRPRRCLRTWHRRRDRASGSASSPSCAPTPRSPSLSPTRARGADDRGRRRRDASYGVARDSHPVSTTSVQGALMASLAERTASPWTATSMRDRPAGCSTCASSLCGAVCGNGRWPAADVDGLLVPIGWRRGFGAAPAMMVPRRRGATNTTLAATQRHPCRSGMVTADCARSRSRPETVVASGGTEGSAENSRVHHLSHPLARARR